MEIMSDLDSRNINRRTLIARGNGIDARILHQMYPKERENDGGNHSWTPYPRGEINQYTHQTRPPFLG